MLILHVAVRILTEVTQNTSLIGVVNIIFNLYTESDYS